MKIDNISPLAHKQMGFRLSDETLKTIEKETGLSIDELKYNSVDTNRKVIKKHSNFHRERPVLVPRNVYLYNNRLITREEVDKMFEDLLKEPFYKRVSDWVKNLVKRV